MKKRKIQKLLAVFLAASTSVTAMPAGGTAAGCAGLKSVFAAEKMKIPEPMNRKHGYCRKIPNIPNMAIQSLTVM